MFKDLVDGLNMTEMAAKYHVDHSAVVKFKQRNAEALEQAIAEVVDYSRKVAISDKTFRISELGGIYDNAKSEYGSAEATTDRLAALREARSTLRAVAEELGDLPKPDQNLNIRAQVLLRQVEGTTEELG